MASELTIRCQGYLCETVGKWELATAPQCVRRSRSEGWRALHVEGKVVDLCALCASDMVSRIHCPFVRPCDYPIADLVGHDRMGHAVARRLVRKGDIRTLEQLESYVARGWFHPGEFGEKTVEVVLAALG